MVQRGLISVVLISVRNSRNKCYTPRDTHAVDILATLSKFSGISNLSSCIHSLIRGVASKSPRCSVKVAELFNSDRAQHDFWWTVRRRRWLGRSAYDVNRILSCAAGMVRPHGGLRSPRPYSLKKVLVEMVDMLGPR